MPETPDFEQIARGKWFARGALSAVAALLFGWLVLIGLHAKGVL